jgi:hypothetical protein
MRIDRLRLFAHDLLEGTLRPTSPNTVGLSMASGTHEFGTFLAVNTSTKIDGGSLLAPALTGAIIGDGNAGGTGIQIQSTAYITGGSGNTFFPPQGRPYRNRLLWYSSAPAWADLLFGSEGRPQVSS